MAKKDGKWPFNDIISRKKWSFNGHLCNAFFAINGHLMAIWQFEKKWWKNGEKWPKNGQKMVKFFNFQHFKWPFFDHLLAIFNVVITVYFSTFFWVKLWPFYGATFFHHFSWPFNVRWLAISWPFLVLHFSTFFMANKWR